jgi:pyruvate carboxylase subunit B
LFSLESKENKMFGFFKKDNTNRQKYTEKNNHVFENNNSKEKPIKFSSVELRDGQQSLLATRMKTEDMLPIISKMDEVGFVCMEMWGGATFDACLRYTGDDPWDRIRQIKKLASKTPLRMLIRGQNLVGYKQYPDDIVEKFVEKAAEAGIDIFLVFDGLNDLRNCEKVIETVKKNNKKVEGNIVYTESPVHSVEKYVEQAKEWQKLGVSAIHLEDMAGILVPEKAGKIIKAIKKEVNIPVHFQCHCTGGMADIAYWEAIKAGVDVVDTDISSLSLGTAHPPLESLVIALKDTPYDSKLNIDLLKEINDYFLSMRKKYKEYESMFTGVDVGVLKHKVPGGMLSNLESQLKQMNALDRIDEVLDEVHQVFEDLGYPPLATPFSQMCGAQATVNVLTGERYKMIPSEVKTYIKGYYGKSPGEIKSELMEKVLKDEKPITCRPADLLEPEFEKRKSEIGNLAKNDEDVLTYALFPNLAVDFLKKKYNIK